MGSAHPEGDWVARVYEVIDETEELAHEDTVALAEILGPDPNRDLEVGQAFSQALMAGLPAELTDIDRWFGILPKVLEPSASELLESPAVVAGGPYAERLAAYGVTPLTVLSASVAISAALERVARRDLVLSSHPIEVYYEEVLVDASPRTTARDDLRGEISRRAECPDNVAACLLGWLLRIAQYKPFVFSGFRARRIEAGVRLERTLERDEDLRERWGLSDRRSAPVESPDPSATGQP